MVNILDIQLIVTKPINILPDGTRDLTKSTWRFGGTSYEVTCAVGHETFKTIVEAHEGLWCDSSNSLTNKSLTALLEEVYAMELSYQAYCEKSGSEA